MTEKLPEPGLSTADRQDLDETRRLLYMALAVFRTDKYNLAGTLVNALAHHQAADGADADLVLDHVVNVIENTGNGAVSRLWAKQQISRITSELSG